MGQEFTSTYTQVIVHSSRYAAQFGRNVAPEDMLIVASHAPACMAALVLDARGIAPDSVLHEVQSESEAAGNPDLDKSLAAMAAVVDESRFAKRELVGTEFLLLGLLRLEGSIAARALGKLGLGLDDTRETIREKLAREGFVYPEKLRENRG
ncbi:MAG: hypothetical protein KF691_13805 [Phycisphaeraceae bacterium]|nr:hypothetical protein [Phycisphaeraceae bacterium]